MEDFFRSSWGLFFFFSFFFFFLCVCHCFLFLCKWSISLASAKWREKMSNYDKLLLHITSPSLPSTFFPFLSKLFIHFFFYTPCFLRHIIYRKWDSGSNMGVWPRGCLVNQFFRCSWFWPSFKCVLTELFDFFLTWLCPSFTRYFHLSSSIIISNIIWCNKYRGPWFQTPR